MIDKLLEFLKERLDKHLKTNTTTTEVIAFPNGIPADTIQMHDDAIVPFLIHIEEDKRYLPTDRYIREVERLPKEKPPKDVYSVKPPIALNVLLLFAANYTNYVEGTRRLSQILLYFQDNPFFTKDNQKDLLNPLPDTHILNIIPEIKVELYPMTLTAQNEIWSMLKAPYHPCIVYKIKLLLIETPTVKAETLLAKKDIDIFIENHTIEQVVVENETKKFLNLKNDRITLK